MATKQLRPLVHESYDYLISKLYDTEPALIPVSVMTLQSMVNEVEREAEESDRMSDGLRYSLDDVNYVLRRLTEMEAEGKIRGNDDVTVFGDSLKYRLNRLIRILDEIDSKQ